jgi:hypothetical protein
MDDTKKGELICVSVGPPSRRSAPVALSTSHRCTHPAAGLTRWAICPRHRSTPDHGGRKHAGVPPGTNPLSLLGLWQARAELNVSLQSLGTGPGKIQERCFDGGEGSRGTRLLLAPALLLWLKKDEDLVFVRSFVYPPFFFSLSLWIYRCKWMHVTWNGAA